MSVEKPKEKSEFDEFISTSLRGQKRGIYQQLLAHNLIKSNRSNDLLIKIACISEAGLMSREKKKLDMNLVKVAHAVGTSLKNTEVRQLPHDWLRHKTMIEVVNVAWLFPTTQENWEKYIHPWQRVPLQFWPYHADWRRNNYPAKLYLTHIYWQSDYHKSFNEGVDLLTKLHERVVEEIEKLPPHQQFFEKASALTRHSFLVLSGEFTDWSLPRLLEVQAKISSEIDPVVWRETLALVSQKVEEQE